MKPFAYHRAESQAEARSAMDAPGAMLLAGGTNLIDLMKQQVAQPSQLIDISRIAELASISEAEDGLHLGALARNTDVAQHRAVRERYPLLSQALLAGASAQLRNRATTGGNLMQRTRCSYFYDPALGGCNKRNPGTGCSALLGFHRNHAILGQTDEGPDSPHTCIATNPSDMNVALAALHAVVEITRRNGETTAIPVRDFHRLPGDDPSRDTTLAAGDLITGVRLETSAAAFSRHSYYLKARDRHSYAFALVSVAAGLVLQEGLILNAGIALGGVAHKPWTSAAAEEFLAGKPPEDSVFQHAADLLLTGARGYRDNAFKVQLARNCIVQALGRACETSGKG